MFKKNEANIQPSEQAWSIKNLLYGQKRFFFLAGNNAENPERV